MTTGEFIQIVGAVVSAGVIFYQILVVLLYGRGGDPQHRTIARTLDRIQDEQMKLLRQISQKVK